MIWCAHCPQELDDDLFETWYVHMQEAHPQLAVFVPATANWSYE